MAKTLLVLSTSRTSEKAVDFAVCRAKEKGEPIVALYIIEEKLTDEVFNRFTDIGFIGDKPSSELVESIMKEYRQRGYEEVGKVQVKAMEAGVSFDAVTVEGDFTEEALKAIDDHDASMVVVVKKKKSIFMKYFSRSFADEISERASVEVKVFED
ncbi:MAG: universal stress protein [Deltaproteobacteria bacterium]|nr:universal stress protein [Deltaproteobacteria bacterium]